LCGMVRQSDQEGALLLSNVSRPGNRRIRAPNQPTVDFGMRIDCAICRFEEPSSWASLRSSFTRRMSDLSRGTPRPPGLDQRGSHTAPVGSDA
jgi:hypothetical protein